MPVDRDRAFELDARTARLGREWFAEVRQKQRDETAAAKRQVARDGDSGDADGPWDWLTGDTDSAGTDGGD